MNPPQAFYDFKTQFHQDLHLTPPLWASDSATARHDIYAVFARGTAIRRCATCVSSLGNCCLTRKSNLRFSGSTSPRLIGLCRKSGSGVFSPTLRTGQPPSKCVVIKPRSSAHPLGNAIAYPFSIRSPWVASVRTASRRPGSSPALRAARISRWL